MPILQYCESGPAPGATCSTNHRRACEGIRPTRRWNEQSTEADYARCSSWSLTPLFNQRRTIKKVTLLTTSSEMGAIIQKSRLSLLSGGSTKGCSTEAGFARAGATLGVGGMRVMADSFAKSTLASVNTIGIQ